VIPVGIGSRSAMPHPLLVEGTAETVVEELAVGVAREAFEPAAEQPVGREGEKGEDTTT